MEQKSPVVKKMNLDTIRNYDPFAEDILITCSATALYKFDEERNSWITGDVEGVLFIYTRTKHPVYNIFLLNKLRMTNFITPFTPSTKLDISKQFIIIDNRNGNYDKCFKRNNLLIIDKGCDIYGVWFEVKEQFIKIEAEIKRIMAKQYIQNGLPGTNQEISINERVDENSTTNCEAVSVKAFFEKSREMKIDSKSNANVDSVQNWFKSFQISTKPNETKTCKNNDSSIDKKITFTPAEFFTLIKEEKKLNNMKTNPDSRKSADFTPAEFFTLIKEETLNNMKTSPMSPKSADWSLADIPTKITSLTADQIMDATYYLLKYDDEFPKKLYDAHKKIEALHRTRNLPA